MLLPVSEERAFGNVRPGRFMLTAKSGGEKSANTGSESCHETLIELKG